MLWTFVLPIFAFIQEYFKLKMKSFDLLQIQMQWLGILPFHRNQNRNQKVIRQFLSCAIFGVFSEFFLTTFWYFAFTASSIIEYAESFYVVAFSVVLLIWYTTYLWHRNDFRTLFLDLDKIVQRSK